MVMFTYGGLPLTPVSSLVGSVAADRCRVQQLLGRRRRAVRAGLAAGLQPGVDAAVDRDLRDVAVLTDVGRELGEVLRSLGAVPRGAAGAEPELPRWLWDALPSEAHRTILRLRAGGQSWRAIASKTGIAFGNCAAMAREVARVAAAWPAVLRAAADGLGRREIARRLGLCRWAVRAVLLHAPPALRPSPGDRALPPAAENSSTAREGRSSAPLRPQTPAPGWRLLRTDPGWAIGVKAEAESRAQARFGSDWRAHLRCVALVRPGPAVGPVFADLLAVQWLDPGSTGACFEGLTHLRGWVGRLCPAVFSDAEADAWFRHLGWDAVPEARP